MEVKTEAGESQGPQERRQWWLKPETFGGDLGSITESPGKWQDPREGKWLCGMFQQQGLNQPCRDFPHTRLALNNKTHLLLPRVAGD